jgi:hypothetical protein
VHCGGVSATLYHTLYRDWLIGKGGTGGVEELIGWVTESPPHNAVPWDGHGGTRYLHGAHTGVARCAQHSCAHSRPHPCKHIADTEGTLPRRGEEMGRV